LLTNFNDYYKVNDSVAQLNMSCQ